MGPSTREVVVTQRVCVRPHTTWETSWACRGLRDRGLTQVISLLSPWPHCPRSLAPHDITSSGVIATVCSALLSPAMDKDALQTKGLVLRR